ncbi:thiamine pyrophosphate-binding protein [Luedemannella helvata]|uniref:Thiamine pyrophosphate-binding protein n=1 Tax=Luedemannella helvata TaxID=349315 RepID=A0ABN2JW34_9ACTN
MHGYEAVAQALRDHGVDTLFGVMGDSNMAMITHFADALGGRYVAARHENGALCMASGYARTSGRVGIATVTHGPGVSNAITALRAAVTDHAPIVVVVGDTPEDDPFHLQNIDHAALVGTTGAGFVQVTRPDDLRPGLAHAVSRALERHSPVFVNLAADLLMAQVHPDPGRDASPSWPDERPLDTFAPGDTTVGQAVDLLRAARRPVILAGAGAHAAYPVLAELAHLSGALLCTTLLAHGAFRNHPHDLGVAGGFSTPTTRSLLAECDLLLVFGASLSDHTVAHGSLFGDIPVVQFDLDNAVLGRRGRGGMGVVAPATAAAEAVVAAAREAWATGPRPAWATAVRPFEPPATTYAEDGDGVDPRRVFARLDELLPAERIVATDGGHFIEWPCRFLSVPDQAGFLLAIGAGAVGMGLATGLGAALARPERACVIAAGDGGLLMTLPELETAARERIDALIVVVNDGAYSAEVHKLRAMGLPVTFARFHNPSFVALARSLGLAAEAVASTADIETVLPRLIAATGPRLLEIKADPAVVSARLQVPSPDDQVS